MTHYFLYNKPHFIQAKTSTLYFTGTSAVDTKTYTCTISINLVTVTKEIKLYAIGEFSIDMRQQIVNLKELFTTCHVSPPWNLNPSDLDWSLSYGVEGDSVTKVCKYTDTTHAATAVNIKKDAGGSYTTNGLTLDTMSSSSPYIRTLSATSMAAGNEGNYQCSVETASFTYTSPNARLIMLCKLQNSSQSTNNCLSNLYWCLLSQKVFI